MGKKGTIKSVDFGVHGDRFDLKVIVEVDGAEVMHHQMIPGFRDEPGNLVKAIEMQVEPLLRQAGVTMASELAGREVEFVKGNPCHVGSFELIETRHAGKE